MLRFVRAMCLEEGWPLDDVLPLVTANPARILKLPSKGQIAVGCDADILLLQVSGWRMGSAANSAGCGLPVHACLPAAGCAACFCSIAGDARRVAVHLQLTAVHVLAHDGHALQEESLELQYVIAKGEIVKTPEWVRRQRGGQLGWGRPRSRAACRIRGAGRAGEGRTEAPPACRND